MASWLSRLFSRRKKFPLLGVKGAGKTYLLVSLGFIISIHGWGEVRTSRASIYFGDLHPYVLNRKPIEPTYKPIDLEFTIDRIYISGQEYRARLVLSTSDFSGAEFESAMEEFGRIVSNKDISGTYYLRRFLDLYRRAAGFIVVVDIVGPNITPDKFRANKKEFIMNAFMRQVSPLVRGLELIINLSRGSGKPIFFVFTKRDIHGLDERELSEYFDNMFAIQLNRLRRRGFEIFKHSVMAPTSANDPNLVYLEHLLTDIVRCAVS